MFSHGQRWTCKISCYLAFYRILPHFTAFYRILPHFTIGGSIHHAGQELIWGTAACGQHLDGPQATFFCSDCCQIAAMVGSTGRPVKKNLIQSPQSPQSPQEPTSWQLRWDKITQRTFAVHRNWRSILKVGKRLWEITYTSWAISVFGCTVLWKLTSGLCCPFMVFTCSHVLGVAFISGKSAIMDCLGHFGAIL